MTERQYSPSPEIQEQFLNDVLGKKLNRDGSSFAFGEWRWHKSPYPEFGAVDEACLFYSRPDNDEEGFSGYGEDFILRRYNSFKPDEEYRFSPVSELGIYDKDREYAKYGGPWLKITHRGETGWPKSYSLDNRTELTFSTRDSLWFSERYGISKDFHYKLFVSFNKDGQLRGLSLKLEDDRPDRDRENPEEEQTVTFMDKSLDHTEDGVRIFDRSSRYLNQDDEPCLPSEMPRQIDSGLFEDSCSDQFADNFIQIPLTIPRPEDLKDRLIDPETIRNPLFAPTELDNSWRRTNLKNLLGIKWKREMKDFSIAKHNDL